MEENCGIVGVNEEGCGVVCERGRHCLSLSHTHIHTHTERERDSHKHTYTHTHLHTHTHSHKQTHLGSTVPVLVKYIPRQAPQVLDAFLIVTLLLPGGGDLGCDITTHTILILWFVCERHSGGEIVYSVCIVVYVYCGVYCIMVCIVLWCVLYCGGSCTADT